MAASSPSMTPSATAQEALHALLREVLPPQGRWSDEEYLWLTDRCNRLIEFTDGHVQELPMPTFTPPRRPLGALSRAAPPGHGFSRDSPRT